MKKPRASLTAALAAGLIAAAPRLAQACAMCGLPPGDHEAHAFNASVLFMIASPYTIFGLAAAGFYLAHRSARRRRRAASGILKSGSAGPAFSRVLKNED